VRIAIITNFCPHYRAPLFLELSRRVDLTVVLTSRGRERYWEGPRPEPPAGVATLHATSAQSVARLLARHRYDAVVAGLTGRATLLAALATAKLTSTPLVVWVGIWAHPSRGLHRLTRIPTRLIYRCADSVLTYGEHVSRYVAAEAGRTANVFVAPQAVETTRFRVPLGDAALAEVRGALQLDHRPVVLYVGRLATEKGVEYLIEASARARVPHQLLVAGSGPLRPELEKLAFGRSRGPSAIRFLGHVDQPRLPAVMRASDVLVLPSVSTREARETWGLVVNEAMSSGLPVIATEVVGAAAGGLVVSGRTGTVVPQRDPEALAVALDDLLSDPLKRRRLGRAASEHVESFNYDAAADAFVAAARAAASDS
jgi:glycosyltransferase involved in cell wall biosynthesis